MALHELDIFNRALSRVGDARLTTSAEATPSAITAANPASVTTGTHGYVTGDFVLARNIGGMVELEGRIFRITRTSDTVFTLDDEDSSGHTAFSAGTLDRFDKLPTNKATKSCYNAWPDIRDEVLRVHPWNSVTKRDRLARLESAKTLTAATVANPVVVTSTSHGYSNGDEIKIEDVVGMTEINDRWFVVAGKEDNTFQLSGENGLTHTAYSSAGTAKKADTPFVPDSGFAARYTLPSDSLRILNIVGSDHTDLWMLEGNEMLCDILNTVKIRYIKQELDVTKYESTLVSAITERFAGELAEELTQSTSKQQLHLTKYQAILNAAKSADAQESSSMPLAEDEWLTVRN